MSENLEERIAKIMFNKSGGTASKNGTGAKMTIPKKWVNEMGLDSENREVKLLFNKDEKTILIKVKDME